MNRRLAFCASLLFLSFFGSDAWADSYYEKKQAYLGAKEEAGQSADEKSRWKKSLDKRIGVVPAAPINIYNLWTHEMLAFDVGDTGGPKPEVVNRFLRCHFTNAPTDMATELFPVLLKAAKHFKVKRVNIVSGFRDPKYNLTLRKKGRQVARESEHTEGHAVDFRLPGVRIEALHKWARTLRLGGVGFYQRSGFIHVDIGRIRYWNGS